MAVEEYIDLGESTLDADFFIADPSLSPTSAASFPAAPNFTVRVDDGTDVDPARELFKVTAIAGGDFTITPAQGGTVAADHAAGSRIRQVLDKRALNRILADSVQTGAAAGMSAYREGNLYLPDDDIVLARDNGSGGFEFWGPIRKMTPPVSADFAWVNQGPATIAAGLGYVHLNSGAGVGGYNFRIRNKAAPSPPYTVEIMFRHNNIGANNEKFVGLTIDDGTKVQLFGFGYHNSALCVWDWNSVTSSNTNPLFDQQQANVYAFVGQIWLKMVNNGTNRLYYISNDGLSWLLVYTETNTNFLTETNIGHGITTNAGSTSFITQTVYHFKTY